MTDTSHYPATSPGDLKNLLDGLVPSSTRAGILQALRASGVITSPDSRVGVALEQNVGSSLRINTNQTQAVVLGADTGTNIHSNGPLVIATSGGNNYVDISNYNPKSDHADTVIGGSGSDYIYGNNAASLLKGGSGAETIQSGGGQDTIVGGSGINTLIAGGRSDVFAGAGTAKVQAGLYGGSHDTVHAGTGQDTISLRTGNNTVYGPGRTGSATIVAGSGNDTIYGGAGSQTVTSGSPTEIHLGHGSTTLKLGNRANDTVFGSSNTGTLQLNRASSDVASTHTVDGRTTITFTGGACVTTVGDVNVAFADHTRKSTTS